MTNADSELMSLFLTPGAVGQVACRFDSAADFSAYRAYAWSTGHEAPDPAAHGAIVAAIDAEMAGLGLTRAEPARADVILTYHTVRGLQVDLKMLDALRTQGRDTAEATRVLGRLAVVLSRPVSRTTVWTAGIRRCLRDDASSWNEDVRRAVSALFGTYPTRKPTNEYW